MSKYEVWCGSIINKEDELWCPEDVGALTRKLGNVLSEINDKGYQIQIMIKNNMINIINGESTVGFATIPPNLIKEKNEEDSI